MRIFQLCSEFGKATQISYASLMAQAGYPDFCFEFSCGVCNQLRYIHEKKRHDSLLRGVTMVPCTACMTCCDMEELGPLPITEELHKQLAAEGRGIQMLASSVGDARLAPGAEASEAFISDGAGEEAPAAEASGLDGPGEEVPDAKASVVDGADQEVLEAQASSEDAVREEAPEAEASGAEAGERAPKEASARGAEPMGASPIDRLGQSYDELAWLAPGAVPMAPLPPTPDSPPLRKLVAHDSFPERAEDVLRSFGEEWFASGGVEATSATAQPLAVPNPVLGQDI